MTKETFMLYLPHGKNMDVEVLVPTNPKMRPFGLSDTKAIQCPYELQTTFTTFEFDRKQAIREVNRRGYDFCWNHCDITACPTYIKERGK